MSHRPGRRAACRAGLAVAAAAVLAACGDDHRPPRVPAPADTEPPRTAAPPTVPAVPSALPRTVPWRPGQGEVHPELKRLATEFVERAGSWDGGQGSAADIARRVRAAGGSAAAAASAAQLADGAAAASVRVLYPQYGGLNARRASVMLLAEQALLGADGSVTRRQLALDLRIDRGAEPEVAGIQPKVQLGPARSTSTLGQALLRNRNVVLAAPAAADVRGGYVSDDLLEIVTGLARDHELEVQVFRTGHPLDVFDTGRTSNHTRGRAVDIRRIDGSLVTVAPRALLTRVLTEAGGLGATEVGGPFDLNGGGPGYFTDQVHQDHLHVAVTAGRPAARP